MNKLAEVVGLFENGTAKIKFAGEETPSEKEYGFNRNYIPKVGDTVFMADFNGSYIIMCAVDYQVPAQKPINLNYIKGNTVIEGDLTLKGGAKTVEAVNGKFNNLEVTKIKSDALTKDFEEIKKSISEAKSKADSAQSKADSAYSQANIAKNNANTANRAATTAQSKANSNSTSISTINRQIASIQGDIRFLKMRIR